MALDTAPAWREWAASRPHPPGVHLGELLPESLVENLKDVHDRQKQEALGKTDDADPKPSRSPFFASVAAATALVMGCGGGGDSSTPGTATRSAAPNQRALGAHFKASAAVVTPMLPSDPKWGSEDKCDDSELIKITSDTDYDAVLLSRHRHCSTLVSPPTELRVTLMRRTGSTSWELYSPNTPNLEAIQDWTYGTATVETDVAAYGPQAQLNKRHELRMRIASFVRDADFPIAGGNYSVEFSPELICDPKGQQPGTSGASCGSLTLPKSGNISLAAGAQSDWVGRNVTFAWASELDNPNLKDFQEYELTVRGIIPYVVQGVPLAPGYSPNFIYNDSPDGRAVGPILRCDKDVPKGKTTGCVYPRAAAVWVVDSSTVPEIAEHIRDAQTTVADGRTGRSPGVYIPKIGTRAVPSYQFEGPWNQPLQRETGDDERNANRRVACGGNRRTDLPYTA
jgi:hypothetical protein